MLFVLHSGAVITIAILNPIADVQHGVEGCALLALKLYGFSMNAAEVLKGAIVLSTKCLRICLVRR